MSLLSKTECLDRLMKLNNCMNDMVEFLREEKLIEESEVTKLRLSSTKAKDLLLILEKLKANDRLQLLTFDWVILPVERIKIRMLSDRVNQEYTHNW